MSPDPGSDSPADDKSVGELVLDVSDRMAILIREEIELAKTEVAEKFQRLLRGGVTGIVAGVFALAGFVMLMNAIAWGLDDAFFDDHIWAGFLIEAVLWFLIAAGAGLFAYRSVQAGAPPVPERAIEEAKKTREALEGGQN